MARYTDRWLCLYRADSGSTTIGSEAIHMKNISRKLIVAMVIFLLGLTTYAHSSESILANHSVGRGKIEKAQGNIRSYLSRVEIAIQGQTVERLAYRQFTILLNPLSNGQYELQVYRWVAYGNREVNSTFSSVFSGSEEYSYDYDAGTQTIVQYHFVFPPNSLTGWANPDDYATMPRLPWGENIPSKTCSTPVFSLEEFGREYLQAACFQNRDVTLRFAKRFIDYVSGARGL